MDEEIMNYIHKKNSLIILAVSIFSLVLEKANKAYPNYLWTRTHLPYHSIASIKGVYMDQDLFLLHVVGIEAYIRQPKRYRGRMGRLGLRSRGPSTDLGRTEQDQPLTDLPETHLWTLIASHL